MEKKIVIAIDGYASCGKSTLAKGLAKALGYAYIDTGAMYRATTLFFLRNSIDFQDDAAINTALTQINIHFEVIEGINITFLNGENVENAIREMDVSSHVSQVAAISAVRRAMVAQQQEMGKRRGVVLDGRDIGTVVFKDAELKIFMTASMDVRIQRRLTELLDKGLDVDEAAVKQNLEMRDHIDTTRDDSPLEQADDAIVLDNSTMSREAQLDWALKLANEKIGVLQ